MTIAMSMISGKLGEDKQNKQEKSETAIRESIGVVPLALPLMAGPGAISSTIVWGTRYHSIAHLIGFSIAIALFAACCWGIFRMAPWLVRLLGQTGINVITRIMGLLLMALGIEFIVTGIKALFPRIDSIAGVSGAGLGLAFERLLAKVIPGTNNKDKR